MMFSDTAMIVWLRYSEMLELPAPANTWLLTLLRTNCWKTSGRLALCRMLVSVSDDRLETGVIASSTSVMRDPASV